MNILNTLACLDYNKNFILNIDKVNTPKMFGEYLMRKGKPKYIKKQKQKQK